MIRVFQADDLETIMDIGNRAWRDIYRMFRETYGEELFNILVPDPATEKGLQVKRHAERYPEWLFICEEEGRIVGFVTFKLDREKQVGEILNNAVDPDCGLKGKGQEMYRAVLRHFRENGMRYAAVGTGLDWAHAPARRAYERAGFTIRHEEVRYYKRL